MASFISDMYNNGMGKEVFKGVASWFIKDQAAEDVAHGFPVAGSKYNSGLVMAALKALSKLGLLTTRFPRVANFFNLASNPPAPAARPSAPRPGSSSGR